jgi:hypothetical protein
MKKTQPEMHHTTTTATSTLLLCAEDPFEAIPNHWSFNKENVPGPHTLSRHYTTGHQRREAVQRLQMPR